MQTPQTGETTEPSSSSYSPVLSAHSELLSQSEDHIEGAEALTSTHSPTLTQEPSVAIDEKDEQRKSEKGSIILISTWFIWETLAMVLSTTLLVTMVAILANLDQQPQPRWKHVSLNSIISWLSTISKACLLFSNNGSLGQLKWVWFAQDKRPMLDLRAFDSASRGFYASAELIWTLRGRNFATWGSLAVIRALAFGPFAQNLIHYYPNMVEYASHNCHLGE